MPRSNLGQVSIDGQLIKRRDGLAYRFYLPGQSTKSPINKSKRTYASKIKKKHSERCFESTDPDVNEIKSTLKQEIRQFQES